MGKGAAQLGKAVKGKSKEKKKKKETPAGALTDDIRQLEEYERIAKLAEMQRNRLKKIQQQEEEHTRLNHMLLLNLQRQTMRGQKTEALRREVELLSQTHQRTMDRKDAIVKQLVQELLDGEEQFRVAQRTHTTHMDRLIAMHRSRITRLSEEFERDLKALKTEFETERQRVVTQHARETKELQRVIAAVEAEEQKRIEEAKQAHETEREEIRNKNLEDINMLRITLENKIEDLEAQFDDAHQNYVDHTDAANRHFKKLVKKDKMLNKTIEGQKHRIERYQAKLLSWRKTTQQNENECQTRNAALRQQKLTIQGHCQQLKERMLQLRQSEARRLTELTLLSRDARQKNEKMLEEAEKILVLAELTRKLETEREKVLPFYTPLDEARDTKQLLDISESGEDGSGQTVDEKNEELKAHREAVRQIQQQAGESWSQLENFYKKYNKVLLDKLAVEQEKARLTQENTQLRSILQQYLDGIAVTADALDQANPLVIVNGRVNLLPNAPGQKVRRRGPPLGVVEGNVVVSTYAAHVRH